MSTIYEWGQPLPETGRAQVNPSTTVMFDQQWGEVLYSLEFDPREPTAYDYELAVNQFVHEFELTCPEAEVRYVEASTGSNYLRMQIIHHGNSLTLAAIAAAMLIVLKLVLSKIVAIAIASAVVMAGYALYKHLKPTEYQCPIDGETFDSYETLVAHMEYEHPGVPIPDRPAEWEQYLKWGLIGGGLIIGATLLIPAITDTRRRARR